MEPNKYQDARSILLLNKEQTKGNQKSLLQNQIQTKSVNEPISRTEKYANDLELKKQEYINAQAEIEDAELQLHNKRIITPVAPIFNTTKNDEQIIQKSPATQKSMLFRIKLCTFSLLLVFGVCVGWVIGNAIAIKNTASQLQLAESEYSTNLASYLLKISALEDPTQKPDESDTSLSLAEEILPLSPQPLASPTEIDKTSNVFDKICNWLSNIFRR